MKKDWKGIAERIERLLRLRTMPIGFKLYEDAEALNEIKNLKTPTRRVLICQLTNLARTVGWTIGVTPSTLLSGSPCAAMIGFEERREIVKEGTYRAEIWFDSKEEGVKCEESFPHLPPGSNKAMLIGPIAGQKFDPDLIILYGTPAQMMLVVNAIQWKNYERLRFFCIGESSCADYIADCYLSQKPSLTIPCFGERFYGHTQEEELVIGIPSDQILRVVEGLEALSKRGVRYPIPYAGAQMDVAEKLPPLYRKIYGIEVSPLFTAWGVEKKEK
jgi:uncharacterized protein (DUF169 family)